MRSNLLKGIGVTLIPFLIILGIHAIVKPENEWFPLLYALPVMGLFLWWLIWRVDGKKHS